MANNTSLKSPFQKKEVNLTFLDKIFLIIGSFTLLPVRIIILITCVLLGWFCAKIGLIGMDETRPASGFRRILQRFNYILARFIFRVCFGFISPKINGDLLLSLKDVPVVVAAPHTSFFDVWIICWLEKKGFVSAIAREEDKDTPFIGTIIKFHQSYFVRRSCEESRQETLDTIVSRSQDMAGGTLLIFPEGTNSNGSRLLPFKRGGFQTGIRAVQPVVLKYPNRVDCTTWTKDQGWKGAMVVFWRAMATLYSRAELDVMEASVPEGDPVIFGERVREAMGARIGVPLYHDKEG